MSLISPTTLLVAGSMMCTLSPALLVWRIRTLSAAAVGSVHSKIAEGSASHPRNATPLVMVIVLLKLSAQPGPSGLPTAAPSPLAEHPGLQGLPLRIVLRLPVFAAVVEEIASSVGCQYVDEQPARRVARRHPHANDLEVLARLLLVPRRGPRCERLQPPRRASDVTGDAASVPWPLGHEDRLHPRPEEIEVEARRRGRRRWLLGEEPRRHQKTRNDPGQSSAQHRSSLPSAR